MTTNVRPSALPDKPAVLARAGTAATAAAALALGARTWWDDEYQANEGALIGQPIAFFFIIGGVAWVAAQVGRRPLSSAATIAVFAVAAATGLFVGGVANGFVGVTAGALAAGVVVASFGALAAQVAAEGVRRLFMRPRAKPSQREPVS